MVWSTLLKAYGELNLLAGERLPEILFTLLLEQRGCSRTHEEYPQLFIKAAVAQQFAPHAAACAPLCGPLAASATCALQIASSSLVAWAPILLLRTGLARTHRALCGTSTAIPKPLELHDLFNSPVWHVSPGASHQCSRQTHARRVLLVSERLPMIWHTCFPCSMREAHESLPVLALNDHELAPYVIPAP